MFFPKVHLLFRKSIELSHKERSELSILNNGFSKNALLVGKLNKIGVSFILTSSFDEVSNVFRKVDSAVKFV